MNNDRLLDAFNRIGDEPETVQQFRKLVVGLAMSGKLVAPDEVKLDSASLFKQIEAKTRVLIQKGVLREQNPLTALSHEDLPRGFNNPANFVRLGSIARIEKGLTGIMKADPGPYPLVVTAEDRTSCDHFDFDGAAAIVPLVSSAGHGKASLQRLHYQEGKFALGSILVAIFPHSPEHISARFLFEYLTSFKDELLVSQMIGTANVSLSVGKVSDVPVPLVSPSIQRKVDELMGLCDRLAAARGRREAVRDRLAAASLVRLNAPDPDTFQADARFALNALPALTTRADQIKALRQTILNLAVRGKLEPQDPSDEPAAELLKRIGKEKAQLVKDREIRHRDIQPPIPSDEAPFDLPDSWVWTRLGTLCFLVTDGAHHTPKYQDEGVPFLSVKDVSGGTINFANTRFISKEAHRELAKRCNPEFGDILLTKVGTTGIAVEVDTEQEFSIFVSLALLKFSRDNIDRRFLCHLINSPFVKRQSEDNTQGIGNKNLVLRLINQFAIPLPPLAEQHRIVAKVDALMALCDRLEASLTATAATRRRLLDALIAEALAPVDALEMEAAE